MAQRNPMNERYLGDGPGGQTRKSATSAKPKSSAASSVYVKKKPQTAQEKRAAAKAREKEARAKAEEKARKAAEKAKLAAEENGETAVEPAKPEKTRSSLTPTPPPGTPAAEEYRKWRRIYWILVSIGIVMIVISFVFQMNPGIVTPTMSMIILGIAYPAIIGALVIDFRKVKPLIKAQQNSGSANKSPKQLKHEQEAREQAAAMEAARKAAKAAKRAPRRKKNTETIVPGGMPDDTDFKTGSGN